MNKKSFKKNLIATLQKGFSLVELLVVVAIIGVLAGIGIVGYNSYIEYAADKVNEANAKLLADAITNERVAQRGRLKSNCTQSITGTFDGWDSVLYTGDNLADCINSLATNNQITNPYSNKLYSAQYNGWYPSWSYAVSIYDVESWGNVPDLPSGYFSETGYGVSGTCSDDVGGLAIVYISDWSVDPISSNLIVRNKGYVATCKSKKITDEYGEYDFSYAQKFFRFE
jgi:prepilin-type N-terminal cleavage/methylation domain-containing protein